MIMYLFVKFIEDIVVPVGDIREWRSGFELLEGSSWGMFGTEIDGAWLFGLDGLVDSELFHHFQNFVKAGVA